MANFFEIVQLRAVEIVRNAEAPVQRQTPVFFQRENPFLVLSDRMFVKLFRLPKDLVHTLIDILKDYLISPIRRSALSLELKVLLALRFYASGSYQNDIGYNIFLGVSQSSSSRAIEEVTNALNNPAVFNQFVKFPSSLTSMERIRQNFYQKYKIPGIVGVVDCTHVAIVAPNSNDANYPEHIYVNRKNYHSINVQLICDTNLKVLNVNARFPGSCHDTHIWNQSNIHQSMRILNRTHPDFFLIGDSGYPLRPWLQTPYRNATPHSAEERYNTAFKAARSLVERCNGLLKMRFRCLLKHRVLHYAPTKASKIIYACVILHNICIDNNVPEPEPEEDDQNIDFGLIHNFLNQENECY